MYQILSGFDATGSTRDEAHRQSSLCVHISRLYQLNRFHGHIQLCFDKRQTPSSFGTHAAPVQLIKPSQMPWLHCQTTNHRFATLAITVSHLELKTIGWYASEFRRIEPARISLELFGTLEETWQDNRRDESDRIIVLHELARHDNSKAMTCFPAPLEWEKYSELDWVQTLLLHTSPEAKFVTVQVGRSWYHAPQAELLYADPLNHPVLRYVFQQSGK